MPFFIKADGTDPGLAGYTSAYKRADKVVVGTDPNDIMRLLGDGYIHLNAVSGSLMLYGALRFEFKQHSALMALI
jgi:hypothetical protein